MIDTRTVTDVVGSTVASVAQACAREVLKRCEQVRTSRTVGEFVVNSGISTLRKRFVPAGPATAPPSTATPPGTAAPEPAAASRTGETAPVADYDLFTSAQVVELLDTLDITSVGAVLDYEMSHRRRRLVVEAAQRRLTP